MASQRDKIVMFASIRYEPVWVFCRGDATITRLDELRYKRLPVNRPGNGGRLIVEPLLKAGNVTPLNTNLSRLAARRRCALQSDGVDAILVGATTSPIIRQALQDESLKPTSIGADSPTSRA